MAHMKLLTMLDLGSREHPRAEAAQSCRGFRQDCCSRSSCQRCRSLKRRKGASIGPGASVITAAFELSPAPSPAQPLGLPSSREFSADNCVYSSLLFSSQTQGSHSSTTRSPEACPNESSFRHGPPVSPSLGGRRTTRTRQLET